MARLLIRGNALRLPLADRSVQCILTSPPYYGLRDYGVAGQIGLESTPSAYVAAMVEVFREVKRVLRDDGTVWLNIGDSFNAAGRKGHGSKIGLKQGTNRASACGVDVCRPNSSDLKPKDLIGIPWMLAFALRDDGWHLRSEIIWAKGNAMPESVTDRPTKAHEQVFLLAKNPRYFYDVEAIKEKATGRDPGNKIPHKHAQTDIGMGEHRKALNLGNVKGVVRANARSVWTINTTGFPGSHFAVMPLKLATCCIKAGTSAKGACPKCGAPWRRVISRRNAPDTGASTGGDPSRKDGGHREIDTITAGGNRLAVRRVGTDEWQPTCKCGIAEVVPQIVLDPFGGAGTTVLAAENLARIGIMTELSSKYLGIARRRLERPHARHVVEKPSGSDDMPLFRRADDGTTGHGEEAAV
jgi:DNA modification methylase